MRQNRKRFYFLKSFLRWNNAVQNVMWGPLWPLWTFVLPCSDGGRAHQPGGLPVWRLLQDPGAALSAVCCGIAAAAAGRGAWNSTLRQYLYRLSPGEMDQPAPVFWLQTGTWSFLYKYFFVYIWKKKRWIKPDGWFHWSVWTDDHIPSIYPSTASFGPKDVFASSCVIKAAFFSRYEWWFVSLSMVFTCNVWTLTHHHFRGTPVHLFIAGIRAVA